MAKFVKADRTRNAKLKQLFLYVVGVRDLGVVESFFKDIKDVPVGDITATETHGKAIAFVVCYGRIFNNSEGVGRLRPRDFLQTLSPEEEQLHKWLYDARNEFYAHVDPQHTQIFVNFNQARNKHVVFAQLPYHLFSTTKEITETLLKKLRIFLEERRDQLAAELFRGKTNTQLIIYNDGFQEREITDKG